VEPSLPDGQPAILQADVPVWLVAIDEQKVSYRGWGDTIQLRILPGVHVLEISLAGFETITQIQNGLPTTVRLRKSSMGTLKVSFTARQGRTCQVSYETDEEHRRWKAFINEFPPFGNVP
jgi:hypothetical protein